MEYFSFILAFTSFLKDETSFLFRVSLEIVLGAAALLPQL
jgi:hypothetical protein